MSVKFGVLGLLMEGPDHGYRIRRRFEDKVGHVWDLNRGQVYQTLRSLVAEGLVVPLQPDEAEENTETDILGRRRYELTDAGRVAIQRWVQRAPATPKPMRDELLIRLMLLQGRDSLQAIARIDAQERVYQRHLSQLLARKRRIGDEHDAETLVASFGVEAAIRHALAHLGWLKDCRERLADHATE